MRRLLLIFGWMLLGVVLGALIAPYVYRAGTAFGAAWEIPLLVSSPFGRYLNRCLMAVVGGLLCFLLWRGRGLTRASLGWHGASPGALRLGLGLPLGLGLAGVIALWAHGGYVMERALTLGMILSGVGTGIAVALLEETFFRGALMSTLRAGSGPRIALWGQAFIYAFVHFWHAPPYVEGDVIRWYSGLALLPHYFQFGTLIDAAAAWAVLVALGLLLGRIRTTTSILPAVVCHALLVSIAWVGDRLADGPGDLWWDKDFRFGLAPALLMVSAAAWVWWQRGALDD